MSNYQQPYGAGYGTQEQSHQSYLPPTYSNPYMQGDDGHAAQGHVAANYHNNAAAYGYNTAVPSFPPAAVASGVPPLPIFQGWNQDSIPLPAYTTPQYNNYANPQQQTPQYYQPPVSGPSYQQNGQGEMSEGEFDDSAHATHTPSMGFGTPHYASHDAPGYSSAPQRAVYSKPQDYGSQQPAYSANSNNNQYANRATSQLKRQQSGSYSPYVSPVGADRSDQVKDAQQYNASASGNQKPATASQQNQSQWPQQGKRQPSQPISQKKGRTPPKAELNGNSLGAPAQSPPTHATSPPPSVAMTDGRKKAQGAVLNLWSVGVRYESYLEEGLAEDVVGQIFDDLKFPRTSTPDRNGKQQAISEHQSATTSGSQVSAQASTSKQPSSIAGGQLPKSAPTDKGKEKEHQSPDRSTGGNLARKESVAASTVTSTAPSKTAEMTEKQRTLQSKMEALRKSREERAQKAATKNLGKSEPQTTPAPVPTPIEPPQPAKPVVTAPMSLPQGTTIPKEHAPAPSTPSSSRPPISVAPIQTAPPLPQIPMIPGLFLASASPAPAVNGNMGTPSSASNMPRKRPVAADFDEPPKSVAPFKRPFGRSESSERFTIDVSEDDAGSDDEDIAMDLDSPVDQHSPSQLPIKSSGQQSPAPAIQMPIPVHVGARKPFTPPPAPSATSTPPLSTSRVAIRRPEVLQRKESEIEELKKKIAEAEARKKARQTPSGTRTPQTSIASTTEAEVKDPNQTNGNLGSKVEASLQKQNIIASASNQVSLDQQKAVSEQLAEAKKAAELKESQAEQIRLRRQTIDTHLPRIDAEIEEAQTKLEHLRAQLAESEAALQKSKETKQRLAEEKERLAQEEELLQIQKDLPKENGHQEENGHQVVGNHDHLSESTPTNSSEEVSKSPEAVVEPQSPFARPLPRNLPNKPLVEVVQPIINSGDSPLVASTANNANDRPDKLITEAPDSAKVDNKEAVSPDQALETALQEAIQAEADAHSHQDESMEMEIEASFAPDPSGLAPQSPPTNNDGNQSPEYSPVLERSMPDVPEHEDDYEPPEAAAPVDEPLIPDSPPFSPAPPAPVSENEDHEMKDIDSQPTDETTLITVPQPVAEELLPRHNGSLPKPNEGGAEPNKIPFFTPYESPLKEFRKYRFHPEYMKNVPSGLRSLTYSHNIDPLKEFCRYELAGGFCNDSTCEMQHFKDIKLQDDAILTALGYPDEFKGEQRERFVEGLKEVLMGLRVRKIRDFDVIASEIVAHRAEFLGDKSKVLALEDVDI